MLTSLEIKNFGIIAGSRVEFREGFHALSGETGAGKSILFEAINFVLGARADSDWLRSGAAEAVVIAEFKGTFPEITQGLLGDLGIEIDPADPQLLLRRHLNDQGRSRAFLNDVSVTLKTLQEVGRHCVQHIGQGASRELTEESFLYGVLDQFGGHLNLYENYGQAYRHYLACKEDLDDLKERIRQSQEQEEFIRFQEQELKQAKIKAGESEELEQQKSRLKHGVALAELSHQAMQALADADDSLQDRLGSLLNQAHKAMKLDPALEEFTQVLTQAQELLDQAGKQLQVYSQNLEEVPESLDPIESRLAQLQELQRKYRLDEAGLLQKLEKLQAQLSELEDHSVLLEEKSQALAKAERQLIKQAQLLNGARVQAGKIFLKEVLSRLKALALPHASMQWDLKLYEDVIDYHALGGEALTLLVSFNPGEEMRPFQEVLSGGEMSRLLLALYDVLFPVKGQLTLLFDEVDTGVGGKIAELMGRMLKSLSQKTQVLCITHLPQIASLAHWQYVVAKEVKSGRTFSEIRPLSDKERVEEIARMLAGVQVTDQALKHAKVLLKNSAA